MILACFFPWILWYKITKYLLLDTTLMRSILSATKGPGYFKKWCLASKLQHYSLHFFLHGLQDRFSCDILLKVIGKCILRTKKTSSLFLLLQFACNPTSSQVKLCFLFVINISIVKFLPFFYGLLNYFTVNWCLHVHFVHSLFIRHDPFWPSQNPFVCMYVSMYVCMYLCMYIFHWLNNMIISTNLKVYIKLEKYWKNEKKEAF